MFANTNRAIKIIHKNLADAGFNSQLNDKYIVGVKGPVPYTFLNFLGCSFKIKEIDFKLFCAFDVYRRIVVAGGGIIYCGLSRYSRLRSDNFTRT